MEPNNNPQTTSETKGDKSIGPAIGIIIIILVMVIGSLYFLSERMREQRQKTVPTENTQEITDVTAETSIEINATTPELTP